jgi:hypothetical protein
VADEAFEGAGVTGGRDDGVRLEVAFRSTMAAGAVP